MSFRAVAFTAAIAATVPFVARAGVVAGFSFDNATGFYDGVLHAQTVDASYLGGGVASASWRTGIDGVTDIFLNSSFEGNPGSFSSFTRYFGINGIYPNNYPSLTMTTTAATVVDQVIYTAGSNHSFPNTQSYRVSLQWDSGSSGASWTTLGSNVETGGQHQFIMTGPGELAPGIYQFRWVADNFSANPQDTEADFYALDNVTLVAEPASALLLVIGAAGVVRARGRRR